MPQTRTENELGIETQLWDCAKEAFKYGDLGLARIYLRWRNNWYTFGHLRHIRAFHVNYYPWGYGKPHNRHDRNRMNVKNT